jgi:SAM-dependent methyltransferase
MLEWLRIRWNDSLARLSENPAYWELTPVNRAMRDAVVGFVADRRYERVLDLGAGNLAFRTLLKPVADTYLSVDLTPTHRDLTAVADGSMLPFADHSLDLVLCSAVIEHTEDPEDLLHEIGRVLRPGGDLILTAPFLHQMHGEPHDYWRFTSYGIRVLLDRAGLNFEARQFLVNAYILALTHGLLVSVLGGLLLPMRSLEGPLLKIFGLLTRSIAWLDRLAGPSSLPAGHITLCRGFTLSNTQQ